MEFIEVLLHYCTQTRYRRSSYRGNNRILYSETPPPSPLVNVTHAYVLIKNVLILLKTIFLDSNF